VKALALALLTVLVAPPARPCASCQTGDPTLTAFGTERGYDDRVRVAVDLRSRTDRIGDGDDRVAIDELRSELGLAWAPTDWFFVQLATPLIVRWLSYADAARELVLGVGDVALRTRWSLGDVSLTLGVTLPTAPTLVRQGTRLPLEAQLGSGSFDPSLGLAWSTSLRPWALHLSAFATYPTGDANPSLRLAAFVQYEAWRQAEHALALRLALDARVDGHAHDGARVEPDSGGTIGFIGGDLVASPASDWTVTLGVHVPVVEALVGAHHEGVVWAASLAYDLQ